MSLYLKPFTTQSRPLTTRIGGLWKNMVAKGENSGDQHFLHFPPCFLKQIPTFQ